MHVEHASLSVWLEDPRSLERWPDNAGHWHSGNRVELKSGFARDGGFALV